MPCLKNAPLRVLVDFLKKFYVSPTGELGKLLRDYIFLKNISVSRYAKCP